MGCFHGGESAFQGLNGTESNAKAAVASSEIGNTLPRFAPILLFSFSLMRYQGFTGTFGHSNRKPAMSQPTSPHPTSLGSGEQPLWRRPQGRRKSYEEDRDTGTPYSLLPVPFRFRHQFHPPCLLLVHQLGNKIIWGLVDPI